MPSMTARADLRRAFKRTRQAMPARDRAQANTAICRQLIALPALANAATVAAFMATPDEVDLEDWIIARWQQSAGIVLPRVGEDGHMDFLPYTKQTRLTDNQFGIAEPASGDVVAPENISALLVPLVAFDDLGTRLGMGGGFYDRYLARVRADTPVLGVAFACQHSDVPLPKDSWDVPLHAVVTESGMLEFGANPA